MQIMKNISIVYEFIAGRPVLIPLNTLLYRLALKGLGVWNAPNGERHFLQKALAGKATPVVLDVGANEGMYSRMVMQLNPGTCLHAFEPHAVTFQKLAVCAEKHGFTAHRLALGEREGQATIFDYADDDGSEHASLHEDVIRKIHKATHTSHPIDVITLDAICDNLDIKHIDFLKIDTEGHELAVLKGATKMLNSGKIETIQFEFNEMNTISRTFVQDFFDIMPGYSFYRLLPRGTMPLHGCRAIDREIFGAQNIIAVRSESVVRSGLTS